MRWSMPGRAATTATTGPQTSVARMRCSTCCGGGGAGARSRRNVDVIVPLTVALGFSDEPAELCGYGSIDAEQARELITDAVLRKVCVDAVTGEVLAVESTTVHPRGWVARRQALVEMVLTPTEYGDDTTDAYRPSAQQRRVVERRDRTCTFPSCTAPAHRCDLDLRRPGPAGQRRRATWRPPAASTIGPNRRAGSLARDRPSRRSGTARRDVPTPGPTRTSHPRRSTPTPPGRRLSS